MRFPARPLPRWLAGVRIGMLVVLVGTLAASLSGHLPGWGIWVMGGCALSLAPFRLWDIWGPAGAERPPSPFAGLWHRTDRGDQREHAGDWW